MSSTAQAGVWGGNGCCGRQAASPWSVSQDERDVLDSADLYLRRGLDLKRWWDRACATDSFAQKFPLTVSFNRPDESFGFFDVAQVEGRDMAIMGNYQSLFYDQPKSPVADKAKAVQWTRDQLRQFVLRYFMRVSHFRLPEAYIPAEDRTRVPGLLRPLSWCPEENPSQVGFGFSQHFSEGAAARFAGFRRATATRSSTCAASGRSSNGSCPRSASSTSDFPFSPSAPARRAWSCRSTKGATSS